VSKGSSKPKQGKSKQSAPKLAVVIMAAGKGTRLKSRRPKVLHEVGGKPLLSHVITAASRLAESQDIYAVIGYEADRVREAMAGTGVQFLEQKEQRGTGHAIQCARKATGGLFGGRLIGRTSKRSWSRRP
jgi:bifunctional UDP-N-acetylglucosamine pyrophosphorylase / glucosamine-1-phosphate N-acetyltransferase